MSPPTPMQVLSRVRGWLRGPHVPILLILTMLSLNYMTHRRLGRWWSFPIQTWNMYSYKTGVRKQVYFRRFLAYHADGRVTQTNMRNPLRFIVRPYRVDAGVDRNKPRLLTDALRVMRTTKAGADLVGLGWEGREWNYARMTLAEHLANVPPVESFRVMVLPPRQAGQQTSPPAGTNLVKNGDFQSWDGGSGFPTEWGFDAHPNLGMGADLDGPERAVVMAGSMQNIQSLRQEMTVPTAPPGTTRVVHVEARAHTRSGRATLVLSVSKDGGDAIDVETEPAPPDDQWHRIELNHTLAADSGDTKLMLRLDARGDVFFDDVWLSVTGP